MAVRSFAMTHRAIRGVESRAVERRDEMFRVRQLLGRILRSNGQRTEPGNYEPGNYEPGN